MSDAPSPYAPGIISDEAAPPRPAGRPIVFLVATFAMTIATSGTLWYSWVRASILAGGHGSATLGTLALLGTVPYLLVPLWAYLTDAVPLWGTRREGYLLLTGVITAIVWLALAVAGRQDVTWMAGAVVLGTAGSVSYAAISGALAEIGRRRAATGRLAAAQAGLTLLASFAMSPLLVSSRFTSVWLTAGLAAGLALAVVLLAAISPADGDARPAAAAVAPPAGVRSFLRSRAFWASLAVVACAGVTMVPGGLLRQRMHGASANPSAWWVAGAMPGAGAITVVAYLLVCRRIRFATLLRLALLVSALAPAAQALASRGEDEGVIHFLAIANSATGTLMLIALQDLAMRAAPRGREAFGVVLLLGVSTVVTRLGGSIGSLGIAAEVAWVAAGAAIVGAIAVSLLPATVTELREGRVIGSPR